MIRAWHYLAAGVAAFAFVLVLTFPAQRAGNYLEQQVKDLQLRSTSGTVFSGAVQQLVYQGLNLGPVSWKFRPQALFWGRLEYRVVFTHAANAGKANLGLNLAGDLRASDVALALQADHLINHYSPVLIRTGGIIRLAIAELEVIDNFPRRITGQVDWADAAVVEPLELALGQLTLLLESDTGGVIGKLVNAAEFGISGELLLGEASDYKINMLLRPAADVSADSLEVLRNSLQQQPDGDFMLRFDGEL